jgi:uncharacterized protein (TIGR03067 family)
MLLLVALGLVLATRDLGGQEAKKSKLEGTWKAVAVTDNGKEATDAEDHTITFKGDHITVKKGDQVMIEGTFKRDKSKKPSQIDVTINEGPDNIKGKVSKGIYEIKGDTMKLCAAHADGERPSEFSAPEGSRHVLITLKRESK